MAKQNLTQVRIEDFNIAALRKAAREGRLFIQPSTVSEEEKQAQSLSEILLYVSRIRECADARYLSSIDEIWRLIIHEPAIMACLITSRGKRQGLPNYYRVTSLVNFLLESGVYRKKEFTAVDLHLRLEQTTRRNGHYTGSASCYFTRAQFVLMNRILDQFRIK